MDIIHSDSDITIWIIRNIRPASIGEVWRICRGPKEKVMAQAMTDLGGMGARRLPFDPIPTIGELSRRFHHSSPELKETIRIRRSQGTRGGVPISSEENCRGG
jgi:hypothetical protein